MGYIRPLDIPDGELLLMPGGYEELLCIYITLLNPYGVGSYQLAKDLGLSKGSSSVFFAITMAGWERAPHLPALECFSLEVIAELSINLTDVPIAEDRIVFIELMKLLLVNEAFEVRRKRVFRHDEKASKDNMVRVSAFDPGVSFIERCGESGSINIRVLPGCSPYQRDEDSKLLIPGLGLISDGKRPFESVIEKPRKPRSDSQTHDFTRLLEFYEYGYELFKRAKEVIKTIEDLSIETQRKTIKTACDEIDECLIDRMLGGEAYLSTPSYLAAEWAGLRCGLAFDRPETEYPVTYLMQIVTKLNKKNKQIYFVRNPE